MGAIQEVLSRHATLQPFPGIPHHHSESNNGTLSTADDVLCEASLNSPFGSDASPSYAKAWASCDTGEVYFECTRSAHELRVLAEKGCR
jgi:hypothetical protein